ncbi:hypothetical protein BD310DRAFT_920635 [Dichomitus squalens]|uniref:Uncharacterized protein n=1 Tax=Dichomitus squalens TaxID=114155 RepID=A0A4Q9Q2C2_9APHY|nr:hypothetical protein BD310DRAFT_920635 [Dichomitus squalens]
MPAGRARRGSTRFRRRRRDCTSLAFLSATPPPLTRDAQRGGREHYGTELMHYISVRILDTSRMSRLSTSKKVAT